MSQPSILFLNHNILHRGTFFRNFHLARALSRAGWRAELLTASPQRSARWRTEIMDGVNVHLTPRWMLPQGYADAGLCPYDVAARAGWIARRRFDVMFVSDHLPNVSLTALVGRLNGAAGLVVADWADLFTGGGFHEMWHHGVKSPLYGLSRFGEHRTKTTAHLCTVTSHALKQRLEGELGVERERIHYLPSGCEPEKVRFEPEAARARAALGWEETGAPLPSLHVGIMSSGGVVEPFERKALVALARRCEEQTGQQPVLHCIGPYRKADFAGWAGEFASLYLLGRLPPGEALRQAAGCDLFALFEEDTPINRHRGPIRLTSYLSVGRPVLCNSVTEQGPMLTAAGGAVVWDHDGVEPAALTPLLGSEAHRQTMGAKARVLAEGPLSWQHLGAGFEAFVRAGATALNSRFQGVAASQETARRWCKVGRPSISGL